MLFLYCYSFSFGTFNTVLSKIIEEEELEEEKLIGSFWTRHLDFILMYFAILFGAIFAFFLFYIFLPESLKHIMFREQILAIYEIATGMAISKGIMFYKIIINNLKVLLLSFFLSFIFGAGAIFIILWNASIVGIFLGMIYEKGENPLISFLNILPHGIPEFASYFLAALSGGMISLALLKPNIKHREKIIADSILYFVLSIFLLFVAALIEAFL